VALHAGQDAAVVANSFVATGCGAESLPPHPLRNPATSTVASTDK
jgi:hypothetical protein